MQTTAVEVHHFNTVQQIPTPVRSIIVPGGWVSLDATIRSQPLRFVSVHLDPGPRTDIQLAQAKELVEKTAGATDLPIVFGGDFNAPPLTILRIHAIRSTKRSSRGD
jgi:endonuclease/exonuclease/phosphatase family metal-dependent hydrolase